MESARSTFPPFLDCSFIAAGCRPFSEARAKSSPAKPAAKVTSYAAIDTYIEEQMRRYHIPGLSLAIVEGDEIVHLRGFGRAHPHGEAPAPQTPFFIGSLTKSFTALAIMQLVEAGKIELDALDAPCAALSALVQGRGPPGLCPNHRAAPAQSHEPSSDAARVG